RSLVSPRTASETAFVRWCFSSTSALPFALLLPPHKGTQRVVIPSPLASPPKVGSEVEPSHYHYFFF
uniref:Uncharacterized protein n=1 Tax=Triticum urartu TaxID=4572 RepID=A0A8R7K250_TRIUA